MTTLQDQLETQRSSTMEFQTRESRVSPDGVVTERDVRTTKECNIEGECGHISSELEEDDSVYGIRATGDEGTKCDGPTEKVPYAWRKSQATFRAPNGWVKSTLVPDGSRMDQSGLKRDKTNYTEDDDTLVGSGKAMGQEGEAL